MSRPVVLAAALAFALVACGEAPGSVGPSGIQGRALAGPRCPVEMADTPCPDRPWEGTVIATEVETGARTSAETDPDGRFRLPLPPGTYDVSIRSDGDLPFAKPQRITVHAGEFTDVTVAVDTGIR